jgi:hypothetical protein
MKLGIMSPCVMILATLLLDGGCRPEADTGNEDDSSALRPFSYRYEEIVDFLDRQGIEDAYPGKVRRNSSGTAIFMVFSQKEASGFRGVTVHPNSIDFWDAPTPICFTTGEGTLLAWMRVSKVDARLEFQSGEYLVLRKHARADVDLEGRYFIVTSEPLMTWIGRMSSPDDRQLIATGFQGHRVFSKSNRAYVCGTAVLGGEGVRAKTVERCYVLEDLGDRFEQVDQQDLPWGVVDMDTSDGRFLLYQTKDPPFGHSRLWIYNMTTGRKVRAGVDRGYGRLFLTQDLLGSSRRTVMDSVIAEPDGPANQSQPVGPATSQTSPAAGSGG